MYQNIIFLNKIFYFKFYFKILIILSCFVNIKHEIIYLSNSILIINKNKSLDVKLVE